MKIEIIQIKTRAFTPPKDNVIDTLVDTMATVKDGDIVCITSKVLAIHQGRCVPIYSTSKEALILRESDYSVRGPKFRSKYIRLTITQNILIPSAGIDESNGNGYYILWPHRINKLLNELIQKIRNKYGVYKIGIIITDSHSTPLRRGVIGISMGSFGIEPLKDYRGKHDIFGKKLITTQQNVVDTLASVAIMAMGEGAEMIPMVIIRGWEGLSFSNTITTQKVVVKKSEDIYSPLLKVIKSSK